MNTIAIGLALTCLSGPALAQTFTVSWWGYNGDKLQANIIEPFQEMCGCEVVFETGDMYNRPMRKRYFRSLV